MIFAPETGAPDASDTLPEMLPVACPQSSGQSKKRHPKEIRAGTLLEKAMNEPPIGHTRSDERFVFWPPKQSRLFSLLPEGRFRLVGKGSDSCNAGMITNMLQF